MFKTIRYDVHFYQFQLLALNLAHLNHFTSDHKMLIKISKIAVILFFVRKPMRSEFI